MFYCLCSDEDKGKADPTPPSRCLVENCGNTIDTKCFQSNNQLQECPKCILERNDPISEIVMSLIPPSMLEPRKYQFDIPEDYLETLKNNENLYVELRAIKVSKGYMSTANYYPIEGNVIVNGSHFVWFSNNRDLSLMKSKSPKPDAKMRFDVFKLPFNTIRFSFEESKDEKYYFTLVLVRKNSPQFAIKLMKAARVLKTAQCKEFFIRLFQTKIKSPSKMKISLDCNEKSHLMITPVRGLHCQHVSCFCLECFVEKNACQDIRNWTCPYCKRNSYDVVVDSLVLEILEKARKCNVTTFHIYPNGVYELPTVPTLKKESSSIEAPILIEDDDEEEDQCKRQNSANGAYTIIDDDDSTSVTSQLNIGMMKIESKIESKSESKITQKLKESLVKFAKTAQEKLLAAPPQLIDRVSNDLKNGLISFLSSEQNQRSVLELLKVVEAELKNLIDFLDDVEEESVEEEELRKILWEILAERNDVSDNLNEIVFVIAKSVLQNSSVFQSKSSVLTILDLKNPQFLTESEKKFIEHKKRRSNYYDKYFANPFNENIESFVTESGLEILSSYTAKMLNWIKEKPLAKRKGQWEIVWSPRERWYSVKRDPFFGYELQNDPFPELIARDVEEIMPLLMYLRKCWQQDLVNAGLNSRKSPVMADQSKLALEIYIAARKIQLRDFIKSFLWDATSIVSILSNTDYWSGFLKPSVPMSVKKFANLKLLNKPNALCLM